MRYLLMVAMLFNCALAEEPSDKPKTETKEIKCDLCKDTWKVTKEIECPTCLGKDSEKCKAQCKKGKVTGKVYCSCELGLGKLKEMIEKYKKIVKGYEKGVENATVKKADGTTVQTHPFLSVALEKNKKKLEELEKQLPKPTEETKVPPKEEEPKTNPLPREEL